MLAPYAGTAALLATEQHAGRLRIRPALVALAAEGLPDGESARITPAFGAVVGNSWAATECPFLSSSCHHDWLHVNADWVIVEPVDADHHPVAPGLPSHTVLITNLANRIQPILRYDLGDSVLTRPDPCPCGNALPALRVRGRTADLLTFPAADGPVTLTPLTLTALLDAVPGIELFQLIQTTPRTVHVRLRPAAGADPDRVWQATQTALTALLAGRGLAHIAVARADEPPQPSTGGKYRLVQPLPPTPAPAT